MKDLRFFFLSGRASSSCIIIFSCCNELDEMRKEEQRARDCLPARHSKHSNRFYARCSNTCTPPCPRLVHIRTDERVPCRRPATILISNYITSNNFFFNVIFFCRFFLCHFVISFFFFLLLLFLITSLPGKDVDRSLELQDCDTSPVEQFPLRMSFENCRRIYYHTLIPPLFPVALCNMASIPHAETCSPKRFDQ